MHVVFLHAGGGLGTGMGGGAFFFFLTLGATERFRTDLRGTVAFWLQHGMQAGRRTGLRPQTAAVVQIRHGGYGGRCDKGATSAL